MNKVKILIVEDEIIIADNICDTLEELGYEACEPAINYTEAIETIEIENPDIAILDIQLSGKKTGIDIAKKIIDEYNFPFIFLTSNADLSTISEAKKVLPAAYLVKPFSKDELYSSIEIALYKHGQQIPISESESIVVKDALFIREKGIYQKLNFDDILYIKSSHVYSEIFLKDNKKIVARTSLTEIINKLSENFLRVHRGYIINTRYLDQIDSNSIKINNKVIPIGKKYHQELLSKINLL